MSVNKKSQKQPLVQPNVSPVMGKQGATPPPNISDEEVIDTAAWNKPIFKKAFLGSIIFMLLFFWISGYNVGYHQDEMDMNIYGKANIAYYASGGKDTTYLGSEDYLGYHVDKLLRYYGSAFEYIPVLINKVTGLDKTKEEFNVRHAVTQIFGVLCILFSGLVARRFGGWRAALITAWQLFLSPIIFGHTLFNTKDIPFCAGYIATLYFIIEFLEELPKPSWKTSIYLIIAIAFTLGIRIGGLLLFFYFALFALIYLFKKKEAMMPLAQTLPPIVIKGVTIFLASMVIVILSWPYVLQNPLHNLFETFNVVKKFPTVVKLAFEGVYMESTQIPAHYLPKFMFITIPVMILVLAAYGTFIGLFKHKKYNVVLISFIIFTSIFPIVYAVLTNVPLYSAWRHFLFTYPGIVIIATIGIHEMMDKVKKPTLQVAVIAICALGMARPTWWMIKNHPYEYTYFNELGGGFKKAFYEYETDYWEITAKNTVDYLMRTESRMQGKDSVFVVTNLENFVKLYIAKNYPGTKVRVTNVGVLSRYGQNWTYGIFNTIFLRPEFLEDNWPLCMTTHAEYIDDLPVTILVKDTVRVDWLAQVAFAEGDYVKADSMIKYYLAKICPENKGLLGLLSLANGNMNKCDESIKYANECLRLNISAYANYDAYCGLGVAYGNLKKFDSSIAYLQEAKHIFPAFQSAPQILQQVLSYRAKIMSGEMK